MYSYHFIFLCVCASCSNDTMHEQVGIVDVRDLPNINIRIKVAPPVWLCVHVHSFLRCLSACETYTYIPCPIAVFAGRGRVLRLRLMDFVYRFAEDPNTNHGYFVFVIRFIKIVHLAAVSEKKTARMCAYLHPHNGKPPWLIQYWSWIETIGIRLSFVNPCSAHWKYGWNCRPLTIPKPMG